MRPSDYKKRLLALADFLDRLPAKRFQYNYWFHNDITNPDTNPYPDGGPINALKHFCGTTACALGWATTMPRFRRLGLHWQHLTPRIPDNDNVFGSAAVIFGISSHEAMYLFSPNYPAYAAYGLERKGLPESSPGAEASAKEVARHLRTFA